MNKFNCKIFIKIKNDLFYIIYIYKSEETGILNNYNFSNIFEAI